jgi:acetyltransferase-like isoleucine patch superfamily enzyme
MQRAKYVPEFKANAVVTHDVPDYSVAVGVPARVVKQYDQGLCKWVNK